MLASCGAQIDSQLERLVVRGMERALRVTNAWIFSAGLDEGASSLFSKMSIGTTPLIGIAPLRYVTHNELFSWPEIDAARVDRASASAEQWPAAASAPAMATSTAAMTVKQQQRRAVPVTYIKRARNTSTSSALDTNHTHLLLVTAEEFGKEIALRAAVEERLRERFRVPGVLIVLNGGPWTLDTLLRHLAKDCPVVLVGGTGGAADLLADALENGSFDDAPTEASAASASERPTESFFSRLSRFIEDRDQSSAQSPSGRPASHRGFVEESFSGLGRPKDALKMLQSKRHLISVFRAWHLHFDRAILEAMVSELGVQTPGEAYSKQWARMGDADVGGDVSA